MIRHASEAIEHLAFIRRDTDELAYLDIIWRARISTMNRIARTRAAAWGSGGGEMRVNAAKPVSDACTRRGVKLERWGP